MRENRAYRITSILIIGVLAAVVLAGFLLPSDEPHLWVNYGSMHNLECMIAFSAFLTCLVQGFRSRQAPRWFAIAAILSIIDVVEDAWAIELRGNGQRALTLVWWGSVAMMFLHHSIQVRGSREWSPHSRAVAMLCRSAAPLFVAVVTCWFAFHQFVMLMQARDRNATAILIGEVRRSLATPALLLLLCAVAVSIYEHTARAAAAASTGSRYTERDGE